jgi:hypothetical protein
MELLPVVKTRSLDKKPGVFTVSFSPTGTRSQRRTVLIWGPSGINPSFKGRGIQISSIGFFA